MNNGIAKLADFGVAKILNNNKDESQTFRGTPPFMAPQILLL